MKHKVLPLMAMGHFVLPLSGLIGTPTCRKWEAWESFESFYVNPRPAGVGRTRPLGGGADSVPCLTHERMVVERREKRQTKALNNKNHKNTNNFAKEVRGQVRVRSNQVKF